MKKRTLILFTAFIMSAMVCGMGFVTPLQATVIMGSSWHILS